MQIKELINKTGGNAIFSRALTIPLKTVEGWKAGVTCPWYAVDAYRVKLTVLRLIK